MSFTDEQIAEIAHEANRALQGILADPNVPVAPPWSQFSKDQQDGVISGVRAGRYGASPEALHEKWVAEKLADGWTLGPVKDTTAKTHPLLVPFDQLPPGDRAKDYLFAGVCTAMNQASDLKTRAENDAQALADAAALLKSDANRSSIADQQPFGGATPVPIQLKED